jgi:hypothetical protein
MMIVVRLAALVIGLMSLYMTHLCLKRKTFNRVEFAVWGAAWFGLIVLAVAPQVAYNSIKMFDVLAVSDFIYVVSLIVLFVMCFRLYMSTKEANQKIEGIVRKMAIDEASIHSQN